jgi:hypothetical protein
MNKKTLTISGIICLAAVSYYWLLPQSDTSLVRLKHNQPQETVVTTIHSVKTPAVSKKVNLPPELQQAYKQLQKINQEIDAAQLDLKQQAAQLDTKFDTLTPEQLIQATDSLITGINQSNGIDPQVLEQEYTAFSTTDDTITDPQLQQISQEFNELEQEIEELSQQLK